MDGPLTVTAANTVLNQYATLAANAGAGATTFSVTNIADLTSASNGALAAGDLVMLYQAQGATINTTDTVNFGAVTDLGSAGRYEVVTVGSVSGNTITLDASCGGLDFSYTISGNTQVVRIPQYTTLTVNSGASVTGTAWNGVRGGIVAVQAQSVVMNGTVTANALGFRGGALDTQTSTAGGASVTIYRSTANTSGAEKGEGIAGSQTTYDGLNGRYGRGAPANGGGGGNGHNAGGGGGANGNNGNTWSGQGVMSGTVTGAGAWALDPGYIANGNTRTNSSGGGRGGYTFSNANLDALTVAPGTTTWGGDFRRELGGLGGRPLDNDAAGRLFFGGGGGAGDANNTSGGVGGAGGGMVLIVAGTVSGSGTVTANGAAGANSNNTFNDAPGGGGGGGTVVVRAGTLSGVSVQANGGAGGTQPITNNEAEGPGGGGGGGFIATSGGTVTRTAAGGANGTTTSSALTEFPSNGATLGASGVTNASAATSPVCTVASLATVSGAVFGDTDRNGVRGGGETNFTASPVTVTLTNTATGATLTTTTTTGAYSFSNVPVGTYTVTTSVPSVYFVSTGARTVTVSSNAAGTTTVQDIGLAQNLTPTACSVTYGGGVGSSTASPGTGPFNVYPVDPSTGAAGSVLFAAPYQTAAMARHPTLNRLYYIQAAQGTTAANVGYYDFVTGQQVAVGTIDKGTDNGSFTRFGFNAAGVGYASISSTNAIYRIDVTSSTFSATRLGVITGLPTALSGDFAITAANAAWLSANGNVYRIDLNTLVATQIVNTNSANVNGVAFDSNGDLLLSDTTTVYRVNLGTLIFSTVGPLNTTSLSGDLANCFIPTLTPNLSAVKTVSPTSGVGPGSVLTYSVSFSNSGNAVSTSTTFTDLIPANTTYVVGTTTLNGAAVADDPDGGDADTLVDMPFVNGSPINSPVNGTTTYSSGTLAVGSAGAATVTFQVRVDNPLASSATQISNQGTVTYATGPSGGVLTDGDTGTAGTQATVSTVGGRDFGDAPDTGSGTATGNYQTLGSDNGPSHTLSANLKLGSATTDADSGALQNAAATADDISATDDEDGVASFPYISTAAGQTVTVPVAVTNTTGAAATLVGYLDFNRDGDFLDAGEQSAPISVANGATSASVVFNAPTGLTAGTTYARFRISSTATEVTSSVGAASSGEVEDYAVTIGAPNLTIAKTHTPTSFVQGSTGTYTVTVSNGGDQPTSGTVTAIDTLPAGLSVPAGTFTPGGTNGGTWSCTAAGQTVTCTTTAGTIITAGGSSVFSFGVNVAANAASPQINNVSVSGGGEPAANAGNNAAQDSTSVVAPTSLTLAKADTGDFTVGGTGTYSFTVTNAGGAPSSGLITVTDTLPIGLTYAGSTTGAGWSCSANTATPQAVTCTSSTVISAPGSSTFTFSVNVGVGAAVPTITNTASVVGGGDTTPSSASDVTTVLSPNLTVAKTHAPANFVRGSTGSYTVTVGNSGAAASSGPITVTDTLPTGLSVPPSPPNLTLSGANAGSWTCTANNASPQVITCTSTAAIAISGSSTFAFTVAVAANAGPSVTNEVAVSGGNEATANAGNNTAQDPTPTVDAGSLTLSKTVRNVTRLGPTGVTSTGEPGDVLEYCIGYTNPGGSTVTNTVLSDTVPANTLALLTPYAGNAVQWTVTAPTVGSQTLSAGADADAGELGGLLTVRLGSIPPAGAGQVCFRVTIN